MIVPDDVKDRIFAMMVKANKDGSYTSSYPIDIWDHDSEMFTLMIRNKENVHGARGLLHSTRCRGKDLDDAMNRFNSTMYDSFIDVEATKALQMEELLSEA